MSPSTTLTSICKVIAERMHYLHLCVFSFSEFSTSAHQRTDDGHVIEVMTEKPFR